MRKHCVNSGLRIVLTCFVAMWSVATLSAETQSSSQIQQAVYDYVRHALGSTDNTKITVRPLDKRLKLSQCEMPLETFLAPGQRLQNSAVVGVRCNGKNTWKIWVPVQIERSHMIVVASESIARGSIIGPRQLSTQKSTKSLDQLQTFQSVEPLIGLTLKRPLQIGQPILQRDVCLICKGKPVMIKAGGSGLTIQSKGVALEDGLNNQLIRIRNLKSKKEVIAKVVSANVVQIEL